jgi:Na+/proline symporter
MRKYVSFGARTVPEMLRVRFESRAVQALAGIAMIILLIVYSVGQYKAMATVWTITTQALNTPFGAGLLLTAIFVLVYLVVGGYTGTQWVAGFQGILLTAVGWTLGIAALIWAGGPAAISEALTTETFTLPGGNSTNLSLGNFTLPLPAPTGLAFPGADYVGAVATMFMFLFMATGFPHNIARFLGTRKITKREYWVMLLILIVGGLTPLWIGVVGFSARTVWQDQIMALNAPIYGDSAAVYASIDVGGAALASLFAASVFAASVATLAGMVMIMATNVTRDLIHNLYPSASPTNLFRLTKLLLIPFIAIPLYWTFTSPPPILSEFMSGSAVAQAGIFFFVVGVSMYWRRATKWGAITTIIYGLALTVLHPKAYGQYVGLVHWGHWALLLMFGSALTYFVVSLATRPVAEEKLRKLFNSTRKRSDMK